MPKAVIPWLQKIEAETQALEVYMAFGASVSYIPAFLKLRQIGIPTSRIHFKKARSAGANAADAILTVLYGRHAGRWNLVLSADKKWFSELPHLEDGSDRNTRCLAFREHEELRLCKIFKGYKADTLVAKETKAASVQASIEKQNRRQDMEVPASEQKLTQTFLKFCKEKLKPGVHKCWDKLSQDALATAVKSVCRGRRFRNYWKLNGGGGPIAAKDVDMLVTIVSEGTLQQPQKVKKLPQKVKTQPQKVKKPKKGKLHKRVAGTFLDYCHLKMKQVNWKCRPESVAKQFKQIFQSKRFRRFVKERCEIDFKIVDVQQVLSLVQARVA